MNWVAVIASIVAALLDAFHHFNVAMGNQTVQISLMKLDVVSFGVNFLKIKVIYEIKNEKITKCKIALVSLELSY